MRVRALFTVLMSVVCISATAQFKTGAWTGLDDSETVSALKEHVSFLASAALEGRAAGSEGEREAARYMRGVMESYGIDIVSGQDGDIFGIKRESGDTLTSRNVIAVIPGYDKSLRDRYVVIGARMDNIGTRTITVDGGPVLKTYYGANGNASGMAVLLELARMLKTNSTLLRRSVVLVGFGSSLESYIGAWYFLNRSFKEAANIDAMINLDILGRGLQGFYAFTSSNADMNRIISKISGTLQPIQPELVSTEPFNSDHRMFYASEIPSVLFTTGVYPEYGTDRDTPSSLRYDYMEKEVEYIYNFSIELANGSAPSFYPDAALKKQSTGSKDVVPYNECDLKPSFLGSTDPRVFMQKWVYAYLKYPQEAVRRGIQGRVLVDFIIDERGKVRDVKILKGVDPLLDAEALKVISASPDWKPGRLRGDKVKTELSLYVEFKLEKNKK